MFAELVLLCCIASAHGCKYTESYFLLSIIDTSVVSLQTWLLQFHVYCCLQRIQNSLARAVVAAPVGPAILTMSNRCTQGAATHWIQSCLHHVLSSESSSAHYLYDLITVQPSWSTRSSTLLTVLSSIVTSVSRSQTALFGMLHITCATTFLPPDALFIFLISVVIAQLFFIVVLLSLVLNWLSTFLVAFSTVVILKLSFSQGLPLHSHLWSIPSSGWWNLITRCLAVTHGGSVSECAQLAFRRTIILLVSYQPLSCRISVMGCLPIIHSHCACFAAHNRCL